MRLATPTKPAAVVHDEQSTPAGGRGYPRACRPSLLLGLTINPPILDHTECSLAALVHSRLPSAWTLRSTSGARSYGGGTWPSPGRKCRGYRILLGSCISSLAPACPSLPSLSGPGQSPAISWVAQGAAEEDRTRVAIRLFGRVGGPDNGVTATYGGRHIDCVRPRPPGRAGALRSAIPHGVVIRCPPYFPVCPVRNRWLPSGVSSRLPSGVGRGRTRPRA